MIKSRSTTTTRTSSPVFKSNYLTFCIFYTCFLIWIAKPTNGQEDDPLAQISDDNFERAVADKGEGNTEFPNGVNTIPGIEGVDYPIFSSVHRTSFQCKGRPPGFYADVELRCQAWHICDHMNRQQSFLCPNGTVYSQTKRICDWWFNVENCQGSPAHYDQNKALFLTTVPPKFEQTTIQSNQNNQINQNNQNNQNNLRNQQTNQNQQQQTNQNQQQQHRLIVQTTLPPLILPQRPQNSQERPSHAQQQQQFANIQQKQQQQNQQRPPVQQQNQPIFRPPQNQVQQNFNQNGQNFNQNGQNFNQNGQNSAEAQKARLNEQRLREQRIQQEIYQEEQRKNQQFQQQQQQQSQNNQQNFQNSQNSQNSQNQQQRGNGSSRERNFSGQLLNNFNQNQQQNQQNVDLRVKPLLPVNSNPRPNLQLFSNSQPLPQQSTTIANNNNNNNFVVQTTTPNNLISSENNNNFRQITNNLLKQSQELVSRPQFPPQSIIRQPHAGTSTEKIQQNQQNQQNFVQQRPVVQQQQQQQSRGTNFRSNENLSSQSNSNEQSQRPRPRVQNQQNQQNQQQNLPVQVQNQRPQQNQQIQQQLVGINNQNIQPKSIRDRELIELQRQRSQQMQLRIKQIEEQQRQIESIIREQQQLQISSAELPIQPQEPQPNPNGLNNGQFVQVNQPLQPQLTANNRPRGRAQFQISREESNDPPPKVIRLSHRPKNAPIDSPPLPIIIIMPGGTANGITNSAEGFKRDSQQQQSIPVPQLQPIVQKQQNFQENQQNFQQNPQNFQQNQPQLRQPASLGPPPQAIPLKFQQEQQNQQNFQQNLQPLQVQQQQQPRRPPQQPQQNQNQNQNFRQNNNNNQQQQQARNSNSNQQNQPRVRNNFPNQGPPEFVPEMRAGPKNQQILPAPTPGQSSGQNGQNEQFGQPSFRHSTPRKLHSNEIVFIPPPINPHNQQQKQHQHRNIDQQYQQQQVVEEYVEPLSQTQQLQKKRQRVFERDSGRESQISSETQHEIGGNYLQYVVPLPLVVDENNGKITQNQYVAEAKTYDQEIKLKDIKDYRDRGLLRFERLNPKFQSSPQVDPSKTIEEVFTPILNRYIPEQTGSQSFSQPIYLVDEIPSQKPTVAFTGHSKRSSKSKEVVENIFYNHLPAITTAVPLQPQPPSIPTPITTEQSKVVFLENFSAQSQQQNSQQQNSGYVSSGEIIEFQQQLKPLRHLKRQRGKQHKQNKLQHKSNFKPYPGKINKNFPPVTTFRPNPMGASRIVIKHRLRHGPFQNLPKGTTLDLIPLKSGPLPPIDLNQINNPHHFQLAPLTSAESREDRVTVDGIQPEKPSQVKQNPIELSDQINLHKTQIIRHGRKSRNNYNH